MAGQFERLVGTLSSPRARRVRVWVALVLLVATVVNIPLSLFWYAKTEPVTVLLLSWFQLVIALLELITASQVFEEGKSE